MMYRKAFLLVLAMSAATCLAGCSGKNRKPDESESETAAVTAPSHQSTSESETENKHIRNRYKPGDEIKDATARQPAFQMGSMTVYLGETTVAELTEEGAVLEPVGAVSSLDFEEQAGSERSIVLSFEESSFTVKVKNTSSQPGALRTRLLRKYMQIRVPFFPSAELQLEIPRMISPMCLENRILL